MKSIQLTIYHDTVCPWCRIGKANLLRALDESNKTTDDYSISYKTFFLHRNLPLEGVNYEEYLTSKFNGVPLEVINQAPTKLGLEAGVKFNFDKIIRIPNSILSNVLLYLTPEKKKLDMVDRLGEAYFEKGEDIGDITFLLKLASEQGVSVTADQLQDDSNRNEVIQQDSEGKKMGITGVPFYIFNNKYALFGAQPVSAFKNVIQRITGETEVLM